MSTFTPAILASDMRARAAALGANHPAHEELMTFAAAAQVLQLPPLPTHCPRPKCGRELFPSERELTAGVGCCCRCSDPLPPHHVNFGTGWVTVPSGMSAKEYEEWLDGVLEEAWARS